MIIDDFIYTGYLIARKKKTGANFAVIGAYASLMFFVNAFSIMVILVWRLNVSILDTFNKYYLPLTAAIFIMCAFFILYSNYIIRKRKGKRITPSFFVGYIVLSYLIIFLSMIFFIRPTIYW